MIGNIDGRAKQTPEGVPPVARSAHRGGVNEADQGDKAMTWLFVQGERNCADRRFAKKHDRRNRRPLLHVGEVIYGHVGTADRLNFTVMGAAVNRAAHLQAMAKELGRSVLISADFAACLNEPVQSLGSHPLKGVNVPQEIFAPHLSVSA